MSKFAFNWSDFAFGGKKELKSLKAIFIAAPRDMSAKRFTGLVKDYLPQGNILLGISREPHVLGLEGQPQFKMLALGSVQSVIDRVNASSSKNKIYTLTYSQRDAKFIFEKVDFRKVVLVNGSWYTAFHMRPEFYALIQRQAQYEMVSPFVDEAEARKYPSTIKLAPLPALGLFTEEEMFDVVRQAARQSYDSGGYQTAVAIGRKKGDKYKLVLATHNPVVPYETYAMHHGASREKNFSPMNDLNHYDTIHAEMLAIIAAQKQKLDLRGTTLFINILPCPHCARALSLTDIEELVYAQDHTAGYAVQLFEQSGKKVRRVIPEQYKEGQQ